MKHQSFIDMERGLHLVDAWLTTTLLPVLDDFGGGPALLVVVVW